MLPRSEFQALHQPFLRALTNGSSSFLMSMEAKTANTGPIAVTMSPMTVDMCGPAGIFGRLDLPEIRTSPSGTIITVTDQQIQIVDMKAFLAFNKSSMCLSQSLLLDPVLLYFEYGGFEIEYASSLIFGDIYSGSGPLA